MDFWINLGMLVFTALSFLVGGYKYLQSRFDKLRAEHAAALESEREDREEAVKLVRGKAEDAERKAHSIELQMAREYVSFKALTDFKNDIMGALSKVDHAVTKTADRLNNFLDDRARE